MVGQAYIKYHLAYEVTVRKMFFAEVEMSDVSYRFE